MCSDRILSVELIRENVLGRKFSARLENLAGKAGNCPSLIYEALDIKSSSSKFYEFRLFLQVPVWGRASIVVLDELFLLFRFYKIGRAEDKRPEEGI
jgi:hypothetical protein